MTNFNLETEREINNFRIVERYIRTQLHWSKDTSDYIKEIVVGNVRNLYYWLYREGFIDIDKVQEYFGKSNVKKMPKI